MYWKIVNTTNSSLCGLSESAVRDTKAVWTCGPNRNVKLYEIFIINTSFNNNLYVLFNYKQKYLLSIIQKIKFYEFKIGFLIFFRTKNPCT